jgi:hypothetical protein
LLLDIIAVSWSAKITAYVSLGSDCVVQTNVYIFYEFGYFFNKSGDISYKPVYLFIYPYNKAAYISKYDNPKPVYTSVEVVCCHCGLHIR